MAVVSIMRCRLLVPANQLVVMGTRGAGGGHARTMEIHPSYFQWRKFKDFLHLYTMVGFIPAFAFCTYMNIFTGNADLSETPDGYEPEFHEYSKHPVTRLFSKNIYEHPAATHERKMHCLNVTHEKSILSKIETQVKNLMAVRSDYSAWSFRPVYTKEVRRSREAFYREGDSYGIYGGQKVDSDTPDPRGE